MNSKRLRHSAQVDTRTHSTLFLTNANNVSPAVLNRRSVVEKSPRLPPPPLIKRKTEAIKKDYNAKSSSSNIVKEAILPVTTSFVPVYLLSHFVLKSTMRRAAAVITRLRSGVGADEEQAQYSLRRTYDGIGVEVVMLCPSFIHTVCGNLTGVSLQKKLRRKGFELYDA